MSEEEIQQLSQILLLLAEGSEVLRDNNGQIIIYTNWYPDEG